MKLSEIKWFSVHDAPYKWTAIYICSKWQSSCKESLIPRESRVLLNTPSSYLSHQIEKKRCDVEIMNIGLLAYRQPERLTTVTLSVTHSVRLSVVGRKPISLSAETESKPKVNFSVSAETESTPKEIKWPLSAPKPKFGRHLLICTRCLIFFFRNAFLFENYKINSLNVISVIIN